MLSLLAAVALQAGGIPLHGQPVVRESAPNVLIVVSDDLGVDQIGCYATNYPTLALSPCTPNIDQLAASGVRFTNCWASTLCTPGRSQLLTGRPIRATGVGTVTDPDPATPNNIGLQIDEPSIPKLLAHHTSAAVGKWHLSDPFQDAAGILHPLGLGFDWYSGSLYNLQDEYDLWLHSTMPGPPPTLSTVYATTDTTEEALGLMQTLPEPWVLYVSYNAAHTPLHCPLEEGYVSKGNSGAGCFTNWLETCSPVLGEDNCGGWGKEACQARALTQAMDESLGQLLNAVDASDTAVIFTSDNGTPRRPIVPPFDKDHCKGTLYQGGLNVPLIVRVPGGAVGTVDDLVSLTDIYATLSDICKEPLLPDPWRDSVSLCQYVAPNHCVSGAHARGFVFSEFFAPSYVPAIGGGPPSGYVADFNVRTVRNGTHKLLERRFWVKPSNTCSITLEFFHLAFQAPQDPAFGPDPHESNDLMLDQASWTPEDQAAFGELSSYLQSIMPPLPVGPCP